MSRPSRQFRVAIIGVGAIAELIARALSQLPQAKLLAGSCRTEAKGRKFADQFGCAWHGDFEQMLDQHKPEVAIISTPSGMHLEGLLACAKRKIDVLCEKPLEITMQRVKQMIDAAREAGITLGALFPQRFTAVNRTIYETAAAGRFGTLAMFNASVPWWRDDAYYAPHRWQGKLALDGGGAIMNQAIHTIDQMQWIIGATMKDLPREVNPVEEIFARTAQRGHDRSLIEVEDTATISMRFRDGALGQLVAATSMYPGSKRRTQIAGRDGTIEVHEDQIVTFHFRSEQPQDAEIRQRFGGETKHAGGAANPMAIDYSNHQRNIAAYLDALAEGRQPDLDGIEAAKAVQIVEACYQSTRTGRAVRVGSA